MTYHTHPVTPLGVLKSKAKIPPARNTTARNVSALDLIILTQVSRPQCTVLVGCFTSGTFARWETPQANAPTIARLPASPISDQNQSEKPNRPRRSCGRQNLAKRAAQFIERA